MIQLNDDYRLTADKRQFIVQKRFIIEDKNSKKFGEVVWRNEAYIPSIESMIRWARNHYLYEYVQKFTNMQEVLNNTAKELNNIGKHITRKNV